MRLVIRSSSVRILAHGESWILGTLAVSATDAEKKFLKRLSQIQQLLITYKLSEYRLNPRNSYVRQTIEWWEIDPRELFLLMFMFYHFYPYFYEYLAADNRIMIGRM